MMTVILIFYALGLQDKGSILTLDILEAETGWYYIIPSEGQRNVKKIVRPDNNGVVYLNQNRYKGIKEVRILRNGIDITEQVKFLSNTEHDFYKNGNHQRYELTKFFVPQHEKSNSGTEWDDPEVYYKYSLQEKQHRDKLIQEGKIKFN
jgi:hypothetical protein